MAVSDNSITVPDQTSGVKLATKVISGKHHVVTITAGETGDAPAGGLTNAELRATAVPVSNASLPLPTGAATSAAQTDGTGRTQIYDAQMARTARVSQLQELYSAHKQVRLSDSFADGVNVGQWTTSSVGSGTATGTAGVLRIALGATANSSVKFTSVTSPNFFPGTITLFQSGVTVPDSGTANNIRRWGAYNDNDGCFFELNGTVLSAVTRSNVSGTPVDSATVVNTSLPGTITGGSAGGLLDNKNHTYEISFQGNAFVFIIDRVAVVSLTGQVTAARTATLNVPIRYESINSGGLASDLKLDVRGVSLSTVSGQDLQTGTWGYNAGVSGTLTLTGNKRVLQITAIAEEAAASFTINGGDTITLPYGSTDKVSSAITVEPKGNLLNPTIIFSSTKAYFVEWVV